MMFQLGSPGPSWTTGPCAGLGHGSGDVLHRLSLGIGHFRAPLWCLGMSGNVRMPLGVKWCKVSVSTFNICQYLVI